MTNTDEMIAFLDDLADLTVTHGFYIRGCGCCSSPEVIKIDNPDGRYSIWQFPDNRDGEDLTWNQEADEDEVKKS